MPAGGLNLFGLHQFDNQTSFFNGQTVFSPAVGYLLVLGYGAIFAVLTIMITIFDKVFLGTKYDSEGFNTAGRSIKTGLVAVDVVSHWTWVSDILQSSSEAYKIGISGSFWYMAGASVQIFLFGIVAMEVKRRAPRAHTVVELVRHRWGNAASFVFLYLCYLNNIFTCCILFLGAGNVLVAATGMDTYAALMLVPLGVVIYTVIGGLKATFTSSYLHTVIIFVTLNLFVFKVYASDIYPIGSIQKVWENLVTYATAVPVSGNKDGSYLTMFSRDGLQFGVLTIIASFGNVWADQSYWQSAIAAEPKAAFKSYILGGLIWIPIPLAFATSLGLAAAALDLPITEDEANQGLVAMASAQYMLGKGGVILVLTIIYMAATSSGSAEFIAMSSLFTYDIYKAYLKPKATEKDLLYVSQISVAIIGVAMGAFSCLIFKVGIDINFLFLVVGLMVSSSVPPLTFLLVWPAVPKGAAILGALGGQACAIIAWLVHAQVVYHELSVADSLQALGPTLSGTVVSVVMSAILCVIWTLICPDTTGNYNRFKDIQLMDEVKADLTVEEALDLDKSFRISSAIAIALSLLIVVIWPLLTLPAGVFSESYFVLWIVISIGWSLIASLLCTFLPLVESRDAIFRVIKSLLRLNTKEEDDQVPLNRDM